MAALEAAAMAMPHPHYIGIGATTSDFREGQARPDERGFIPAHILERHKWLMHCGTLSYDMETAAVLLWCQIRGLMAGSVLAMFANRVAGTLQEGAGEDEAVEIGIRAMHQLAMTIPL